MLHLVLLVFAFVFFVIAAFIWWASPAEPRRTNLIAAGLACWVAAEIFTGALASLR